MIARRIGGGCGAYARMRKQAMHKKLIKKPETIWFRAFRWQPKKDSNPHKQSQSYQNV